ncbi:MAG TPA: hypothetical protein PLO23_06855 [Alphaproteobacteria bacterium]|nr:hypothetical protein [Alphaproteobacteria bacterium]
MSSFNKFDYMRGQGMHQSYVHLYETARYFVENPRTGYENMAALMFSCFLLEGYLKHLHSDLFPLWDPAKERELSLIDKLEIAHNKLGLCFEAHSQRTRILKDLIKDRNMIAHSRPIPTSFNAESLACSDSESLGKGDIYIVPTGMSPEDAWEQGVGYIMRRNELAEKQIARFNPSNMTAKKAFDSVVQTIESLDVAACKKAGIVRLPGYESPFSATDSIELGAE